MDSDQINSLRGEADSLALYLAHHKEVVDEKYAPKGQPRPQRLRNWQVPRPLIGSVRCATRPIVI